jgi:Domain of unknown function (DUF4412)
LAWLSSNEEGIMNRPWTWAAMALAVLLAAGGAWASGFEGEVDMNMKGNGHNGEKAPVIRYFVKGHKLRTQIDDSGHDFSAVGIIDLKTHEMIMLMEKQRMYMVHQIHPEKWENEEDRHFKMVETGHTQRILGYACREWDYTSDKDRGRVWFASGLGAWWGTQMASQNEKLSPSQKLLVRVVLDKKLFPMKWESISPSGEVTSSMEVVKVERKALSSGLFSIPPGYKKFDPDVLKQMMQGGGGGGGIHIPGI